MSRDPIDQLEHQLRSTVRRHAVPRPSWSSRARARFGLPLVVVGLVGAGGGGALAATQLLQEGPAIEEVVPPMRADEGAGVVKGDPSILALRVADPYGGPPWSLRVFSTTRGSSCVQVGRVQGGKLGLVVASASGREQFRPLKALPGVNSLCGGVQRGGFPVLRGLRRVELRGGTGDRRRCSGGPCPVDQARVLRFGLLGPEAQEARFQDGDRTTATQQLDAREGGAYLFVRSTDPAPFQAVDAAQQRFARRIAEATRRLRAQGVEREEAARRAFRAVETASRGSRRTGTLPRPDDGIDATFTDGTTMRVAGTGRSKAALPGVARSRGSSPEVVTPLDVSVRGLGARRRFTIAFRAPVAISRTDRHYTLTATGADGSRCTRRIPGGGQATTKDIEKGETVTFRDIRARRNTGAGRRTWCPGRITLRVGYQVPGSGFAGRLVGQHSFVVAR